LAATAIFSSPEPKAVRTADLLAREHGAAVRIDRDLREHARASTGFLPQAEFEEGIERLLRSDRDLVFGDETADAVFKRMSRAIVRARSADPDGDVVAVTHGTALSLYVGRTLGLDARALWRRLGFSTAVVLSGTDLQLVGPRGTSTTE
ncbi:MAG: histidine phosphatase family protein, partial [Sphingomonas sp.]|nr:histidine phosphatase family protein [Sphingomonas sp.]